MSSIDLANKILVDVSVTMSVAYTTGIQRVVKEMTTRLTNLDDNVLIVMYNERQNCYDVLENESFRNRMAGNGAKVSVIGQIKETDICDGVVFVDLDSVWNNHGIRRQNLYRRLKEQGAKVGALIYDIIPISYPQYCHQDTVFHFVLWMSAVLEYCDFMLTNTASTKDKVYDLLRRTELPDRPIYVVPLGADFKEKKSSEDLLSQSVRDIVAAGNYLLVTGTIEPRKNHKLLVKCMEEHLKDQPMNVVFAGRVGWNMAEFMDGLKQHPLYGSRIFFANGPSDDEMAFLYKNAFAIVIASYEEGFGLPIIEAFQKRKPVYASDIGVFREVGGELAEYFPVDDPKALADIAMNDLAHTDRYHNKEDKIKEFKQITWDDAVLVLQEALNREKENN